MKRINQLIELLEEETFQEDDFDSFVNLFRKSNGKIPITIQKLIVWHKLYPEYMYIARTRNDHLELHINRDAIMNDGVELKTLQNFERCLREVSPKLMVLQTTHSFKNPTKVYGFKDPMEIFGSDRVVLGFKEQKARKRGRNCNEGNSAEENE